MAAILTTIGTILTSVVGWMGTTVSAIMAAGNEFLQLAVLVPFIFLGVSLLRRLTRV